jgi:hypothetical protein
MMLSGTSRATPEILRRESARRLYSFGGPRITNRPNILVFDALGGLRSVCV